MTPDSTRADRSPHRTEKTLRYAVANRISEDERARLPQVESPEIFFLSAHACGRITKIGTSALGTCVGLRLRSRCGPLCAFGRFRVFAWVEGLLQSDGAVMEHTDLPRRIFDSSWTATQNGCRRLILQRPETHIHSCMHQMRQGYVAGVAARGRPDSIFLDLILKGRGYCFPVCWVRGRRPPGHAIYPHALRESCTSSRWRNTCFARVVIVLLVSDPAFCEDASCCA